MPTANMNRSMSAGSVTRTLGVSAGVLTVAACAAETGPFLSFDNSVVPTPPSYTGYATTLERRNCGNPAYYAPHESDHISPRHAKDEANPATAAAQIRSARVSMLGERRRCAGGYDPFPEYQQHQFRRRIQAAAAAISIVASGGERSGRAGRKVHPHQRPLADQGAAHPADPARDQSRPGQNR